MVPPQGTPVADSAAAAFDQPVDWSGKVPQGKNAPIIAIFQEYDRLVNDYGDLGVVGTQIRSHVAKLRSQPKHATVLNEPAAAELHALALKHERNNELCSGAIGPTSGLQNFALHRPRWLPPSDLPN